MGPAALPQLTCETTGSYWSLGTLVASVNVHCRSLGGKLSPPQQQEAGAAWAAPTQHPGHLSHHTRPQLVSRCFHISHSTSLGLGPSRATGLFLQGVPSRSSHLLFALVWALGTCQPRLPHHPGCPSGTSTPLLLPCAPTAPPPQLPEDWSGEGLGSSAPKAPDCPTSRSCGSCPHISGCLRPNNMVLSCDPALLKV